MSAPDSALSDWTPIADRRTWTRGDGADSARPSLSRDRDPSAGAWPEQMDGVRFVASTNLTLPGQSTQPASCGDWIPRSFCDSAGHVNLGRSWCDSRECEHCWTRWAGKSSRRITRRLTAYRHTQEPGLDRRVLHVSASPEAGTVRTIRDFNEMVKEAYTVAKERGVRGGVAIPHGYRVKDEYQALWERKVCEEWDGGIWNWLRENEKKDWRDMAYWSPHVHILGVCDDLEADTGDESEAWRVRRIRSLAPFRALSDEEAYEDNIGAAFYTLSHSTFDPQDTKQAVRWFGALSPASFSPEKELSPGALATIERMTEEVSQSNAEGGVEDDEDEDGDCCDVDGCDGDLHPIWEARQALQRKDFCEKIGRDAQRRLDSAYAWATGEVGPPPGLKHPKDREDALRILDRLADSR